MQENENPWGTIGMFLLFLVLRFYLIYNLLLTTDQSAYYFYLNIKVKAELLSLLYFFLWFVNRTYSGCYRSVSQLVCLLFTKLKCFLKKNWSWGLYLTVMSTIPFGKLTRMIVYVNELFYNCSFSAQENVVFSFLEWLSFHKLKKSVK